MSMATNDIFSVRENGTEFDVLYADKLSVSFTGFTARRTIRYKAWVWPSCNASFNGTVGGGEAVGHVASPYISPSDRTNPRETSDLGGCAVG